VKRGYPLQVLQALRGRAVEHSAKELAEQKRRSRLAEDELDHRRQKRVTEQERAHAVERAEVRRLERGESRAADLEQNGRFHRAAMERTKELARLEAQQSEQVRRELARETAVQAALATKRAEARAVDTHRERWRTEQLAEAERKLEEAAQDGLAWRRGCKPSGP
jgi:hypothetical protein